MTTKKDIVRQLASRYKVSQIDTMKIVQGTLDTIIEIVATEGRLELRDFGVFQVKQRSQRKARNPKTGQEVIVPVRNVVTFKPGRILEKRIRGG